MSRRKDAGAEVSSRKHMACGFLKGRVRTFSKIRSQDAKLPECDSTDFALLG